MFMTDSYLHEH